MQWNEKYKLGLPLLDIRHRQLFRLNKELDAERQATAKRRLPMKWLLSLFLFMLLSSPAHAWNGKVLKVLSGDTFVALKKNRQQVIKLYGLECPSLQMPIGVQARNLTRARIQGKTVKINPVTIDEQGRIVARVLINGQSLNASLLRSGYGLVNRKKCTQPVCDEWIRFERYAHRQKNGVWGMIEDLSRRKRQKK